MKAVYIILIESLLAFFLPNLAISQGREVARVSIASLYYTAQTPIAMTSERLLGSGAAIHTTTHDPRLYWHLDSMIKNARLKFDSVQGNRLDARIACVVYREDGLHDTISFGGRYMRIAGHLGYLHPYSMIKIAQFLPCNHQEDIRSYLDNTWLQLPDTPKYGYKPEWWG